MAQVRARECCGSLIVLHCRGTTETEVRVGIAQSSNKALLCHFGSRFHEPVRISSAPCWRGRHQRGGKEDLYKPGILQVGITTDK